MEKSNNSDEIKANVFLKQVKNIINIFKKIFEIVMRHSKKPTVSKNKTYALIAPFVNTNKKRNVIIADKKLKIISPIKTVKKLLKPTFLNALITSYKRDKQIPSNNAKSEPDI